MTVNPRELSHIPAGNPHGLAAFKIYKVPGYYLSYKPVHKSENLRDCRLRHSASIQLQEDKQLYSLI